MITTTTVELKATAGKFRVVGVDTFESPTAHYLIGDYDTRWKAKMACDIHGGQMNPCYLYDDRGIVLYKTGSF
jgi:hypothetical protein